MDSDKWTVLVDQEKIHHTEYNEDLFDSYRISHFYIGGDSKDKSATGGHVTVTNVMLYNEKLSDGDLDELKESKVTIPSQGVEKNPTEPAASAEALVDSESKIEEVIASHEELTDNDAGEKKEEKAQNPVHAASSSTVVAGSSVSEPVTAVESAENSRPGENAQLSDGEKSPEATLNEENESMQRDSEGQPQDSQSVESREATDVEASSGSNDTEQPVEEGKADDRSGGSTSSVAASLSMETATGTGATGAEQTLSPEAGDRHSERKMYSVSSPTSSKSDAEPTSAKDTDVISQNEEAEISFEGSEKVPQSVDTTPDNTNSTPKETEIPSESNTTLLSDHDISLEHRQLSDLSAMGLVGDSTVHGCVSRVFLLLLLGLCV
ncbi:trans-sialidase, putative, partial [Trypanosoma cruzi marinkellei]